MLEQWMHENHNIPIQLVGSLSGQTDLYLYGLLSSLLLRSSEMGMDISEEMETHGWILPDCDFRLVQFTLDDPKVSELSGYQRHRCRVNMYEALRSYCASILPEKISGFLLMQLGCLLGLLYIPDAKADPIEETCRQVVTYAKEKMDVSVCATISIRHHSVESVEAAYWAVQNFEKSRPFYRNPDDRIYCIPKNAEARIADQHQRTQFESTFDITAERICGAVQAEDIKMVEHHLRQQLSRIAMNCKGMPYPTSLNLTINRFVSRLQYRLTDANLADWRYLSNVDFSRELISCHSMEEYLAKSQSIAERLVAHHHQRTSDRHISLMLDIRKFVEENAADMNMGLTAVAREFQIKPREAAESFRRYFDESINDVIHKTRVAKAKELLLTTSMPVQDIAAAVGYCSLATMYRAFTNVEGIAPGKLRQSVPDRQPQPRK